MNKTLVAGDIHGEWGHLNRLINKKRPEIILQCGDFGWWLPFHGRKDVVYKNQVFDQFGIKNKDCKIYWCEGNHEHYHSLAERTKDTNEVMPNVFHMKRGSLLKLPDGRNVLFMGGAESTDKADRIENVTWFAEELITQDDLSELPDTDVDIVISHTCPAEFDMSPPGPATFSKETDPSRAALSFIFKKYRPKLWYFGHYHSPASGIAETCGWHALNQAPNMGWWRWLDK